MKVILFVIAWVAVTILIECHQAKGESVIYELLPVKTAEEKPRNAPVTMEAAEEVIEEPQHEAVIMLAKLIYGEARGCSTMEQAAVVWNALNRVDSPEFPDSVKEVILHKNAYTGYDPDHPVQEEFVELAQDVLERWILEKLDGGNHGRVLPKEYLYFSGNGEVNRFRKEYRGKREYWDWSLPNPYEGGTTP